MKLISIWIIVPIKFSAPTREGSADEYTSDSTESPPAEAELEIVEPEPLSRCFPKHFGVSSLSRN